VKHNKQVVSLAVSFFCFQAQLCVGVGGSAKLLEDTNRELLEEIRVKVVESTVHADIEAWRTQNRNEAIYRMLVDMPEKYDDRLCELGVQLASSPDRARELDLFGQLLYEPYRKGPADTWNAAKILIGALRERLDQYIGSTMTLSEEGSPSAQFSPLRVEQVLRLGYEQLQSDDESDEFTTFEIFCQGCPEIIEALSEESSPSVRVSPELDAWLPFDNGDSDGSDGFALLS